MAQEKMPQDPRNEEDYDTWDYGTEPVPGDTTWALALDEAETTQKSN